MIERKMIPSTVDQDDMILRIRLPLSISSVSQDPEKMTEKSSANARESVLEGNFSLKIEFNAIDQKQWRENRALGASNVGFFGTSVIGIG